MMVLNGRRLAKGCPIPDVPFEEYLTWPMPSQTLLKIGLKESMAHLYAAMNDPKRMVPTDDMLLGSALHCAFLEPEMMPERVILWDGPRRAGKDWEAFRKEHDGKIILTQGYYEKLKAMLKCCRRHPEIRKWMAAEGEVECSIINDIDGVTLKGRCDKYTSDPLIDLKKTRSTDPWLFTKQIRDYGYDIQGWVYCQLFDRKRFIMFAVEDSGCDVVPYELDSERLEYAGSRFMALLDEYKRCLDSGEWPGRSDAPIMVGMDGMYESGMTADVGDNPTGVRISAQGQRK